MLDAATVVREFNAAWHDHDLAAALALTSDDCVFEATSPTPDGQRYAGHAAIGAAWKPIFSDVTSRFTVEDSFTARDHVVQRWRYDWGDGHVRGIDVFAVQDGKVTEKIAYVKGKWPAETAMPDSEPSGQCPRSARCSPRAQCPDPGGECLQRHEAAGKDNLLRR